MSQFQFVFRVNREGLTSRANYETGYDRLTSRVSLVSNFSAQNVKQGVHSFSNHVNSLESVMRVYDFQTTKCF